ncbi:MAG: carrier protein 1 [Pseudomonadota bacterium]|jgi:AAA family ATP:ADP antiporter
MTTKTSTLSRIAEAVWPIKRSELKKFLPMAGMIFAILFNYTLLRNMKDTLVVNAAGAGAITFLKLYCVTPAALLFVVLYMKLSSIFSRETLFYVIITPFLVFFLAFAFIIYPNVDAFHPSVESIQALYNSYPAMQGFIDIYAYWSYSLFYVLAEIWGSVGLALLFWGFANQVVSMEQSKRFYALFIALGNIALIVCGQLASFLANGVKTMLPEGADLWKFSVTVQMVAVGVMGVVAMALYKFLHIAVLPYESNEPKGEKKEKKKKPGLAESFKIVLQSKHLGLIAALVICYGISINLVEVQWKNQVKIYYSGDKTAFNAFMNSYSQWTGIISIVFGWVAGTGLLKKLSWTAAALITPLVVVVGGGIFFVAVCSGKIILSMNMNPAMVATFAGAVVVIASKVVKYALFDSTKNMAYIPLDKDLQQKGQPAVEVVGGRFGKAGGALAQSMLLMIMATKNILDIAPIAAVIFIVICVLWTYAVKGLGSKMKDVESKK